MGEEVGDAKRDSGDDGGPGPGPGGRTAPGSFDQETSDGCRGRIAWFDITTSNLPQSKEFYGKLFDQPGAGTDLAVEIVARGEAIGTLRVAEGKISPFNGVIYVQVADIQTSCKRSKELGGTVAPGFPFNLPDGTGSIALVLDPAGHPLGMYSRALLPKAPPAR